QSIHKRLWKLTGDRSSLETAIWASEKAFYLKNDHYSGINLAHLYNVRASISGEADALTDIMLAQRTRRRVVRICEDLLDKDENSARRLDHDAKYWVLATLAEAWTGLEDEQKSKIYQDQAVALDPAPSKWMIDTAQEQLNNLRALLTNSPLKAR
ncbi:MAG: DUF4071 domain-containing protein, partial [Verrucomicrobia bacterium]|nr:DUF4071 domain-containing protein [Verrucomicrobiota bacterium]